MQVPEDAYEINVVFSDGEGTYDNNGGKDFLLPIDSTWTWQDWQDAAPDRAVAEQQAR